MRIYCVKSIHRFEEEHESRNVAKGWDYSLDGSEENGRETSTYLHGGLVRGNLTGNTERTG